LYLVHRQLLFGYVRQITSGSVLFSKVVPERPGITARNRSGTELVKTVQVLSMRSTLSIKLCLHCPLSSRDRLFLLERLLRQVRIPRPARH
jgi:hypothetical protein